MASYHVSVLEEVLDVSAHWYPLGLQLQVRISMLDSIRIQFQNPSDQLLEMLKTWLTTSDNTIWKTLTNALRSRSVGASQFWRQSTAWWRKLNQTLVHLPLKGNLRLTSPLLLLLHCLNM